MTAPLDRARQLIAKAVDPAVPLEEARSLAHAAAKIIAQHKLLDLAEAPPAQHVGSADPFAEGGLEAFWELFVRATGGGFSRPDFRSDPFGRPPRGAPAPPPPPDYRRRRPVQATYPEREPSWWERLPCELLITIDRPCVVCGQICPEGSRVWAIRLEQAGRGLPTRPIVCHLTTECMLKLPANQRSHGKAR